jgi:excisionase family DNA binding protein
MASDQTYLSTEQAAQRLRDAGLHVNRAMVRKWINAGRLPAVVLPNGRAHIHRDEVDALLPKPAETGAPTP